MKIQKMGSRLLHQDWVGKSHSDLLYQDEVHGSLIEQVYKTVDLIYTKYLKALIDYKGIQRVEQYMFHRDTIQEIIFGKKILKCTLGYWRYKK